MAVAGVLVTVGGPAVAACIIMMCVYVDEDQLRSQIGVPVSDLISTTTTSSSLVAKVNANLCKRIFSAKICRECKVSNQPRVVE